MEGVKQVISSSIRSLVCASYELVPRIDPIKPRNGLASFGDNALEGHATMARQGSAAIKNQALRLPKKRSNSGQEDVFAFQHGVMPASRTALLNHLAALYKYQTYLEIGVRRRASNFARINIAHKVGIDPDPSAEADYILTSDDFFARHSDKRFDLIFIDGSHLAEQVEKDVVNALAILNEGGAVMMHDVNPPTAFHAREQYEVEGAYPAWNGTVWRAFAQLRATRSDLEMYTVDTDWGCGFVRLGHQVTIDVPIESYENLEKDRQMILNLISVEKFLELHPASPSPQPGVWGKLLSLSSKALPFIASRP